MSGVGRLVEKFKLALPGADVWYRSGVYYCQGSREVVDAFRGTVQGWGWSVLPVVADGTTYITGARLGSRHKTIGGL